MTDAIRLYGRYIAVSFRAQMQYRASSLMMAIGVWANIGIEFLAVWALFARFGSLKGWTLPEVAILYGMVNVSFALAEAVGRGFDVFDQMIKNGDFDRLLLRPRGTILQILGTELQLMRIGRLLQGATILAWGTARLDAPWTPATTALIAAGVIGGACLFVGIFIVQATIAFWTTESLEIVNAVTYGGVETAQYPIAIYRKWFREFFIFIVPLACANYFPSLAVTGRIDPLGYPAGIGWATPFVGAAFLIAAAQVWRFGVRRYRSTGS